MPTEGKWTPDFFLKTWYEYLVIWKVKNKKHRIFLKNNDRLKNITEKFLLDCINTINLINDAHVHVLVHSEEWGKMNFDQNVRSFILHARSTFHLNCFHFEIYRISDQLKYNQKSNQSYGKTREKKQNFHIA